MRIACLLQSLQNPWAHGYLADIVEPRVEVLAMTKSKAIKEFFKRRVLPVAVVALLYCIFKSACTKDGFTDYLWLFILCGLPFGIPRMFAWILPGGSLGTTLPLFLLNFIIGRVIGGFVLAWRLLVAAWYVPLTVYRLIVCYFSCIMAMRKTAARADAKAIHNLMEQTSLFNRAANSFSAASQSWQFTHITTTPTAAAIHRFQYLFT